MGSPFTHLYQHYFSNHYPPLDQPFWSTLRRNVDCWFNIFRVDDFVGTSIVFPESLRSSGGFNCQNFPVKRCGHNNYWSDKQVIDLLRDQGAFDWIADERRIRAADERASPTTTPLRKAG
jgi:hypothetical protein